jgi:predicted amidohydrolase
MNSGEDPSDNRSTAGRLIEQAAARGAQLVVLPEMFSCYGRPAAIVRGAESVPGPTSDLLSQLAARHRLVLVGGSIPERSPHAERVFNTSLIFGPDGALLAAYRKIHLFDVDLDDGESYRESAWCVPGDRISLVDTPLGRIGQAICYDLRFPELFRALSAGGAEFIVLPSAFTATTGPHHWETLVRARAIENQVFMLAANQCGAHAPNCVTYGHSLIVDPWGAILATAQQEIALAVAPLDRAQLTRIRTQIPVHEHRRL